MRNSVPALAITPAKMSLRPICQTRLSLMFAYIYLEPVRNYQRSLGYPE